MQSQFWRQRRVDCPEIKRVWLHPEGDRRHVAYANQHHTENSVKCRPQENLKGFPLSMASNNLPPFFTNTQISGTAPGCYPWFMRWWQYFHGNDTPPSWLKGLSKNTTNLLALKNVSKWLSTWRNILELLLRIKSSCKYRHLCNVCWKSWNMCVCSSCCTAVINCDSFVFTTYLLSFLCQQNARTRGRSPHSCHTTSGKEARNVGGGASTGGSKRGLFKY